VARQIDREVIELALKAWEQYFFLQRERRNRIRVGRQEEK